MSHHLDLRKFNDEFGTINLVLCQGDTLRSFFLFIKKTFLLQKDTALTEI